MVISVPDVSQDFVRIATWVFDTFVSTWNHVGTWGIIGAFIIGIPILGAVIKFIRKFILRR